MVGLAGVEDFLILTLAALLPALVYLLWVRQSERLGVEPWGLLLRLFLFGALGATIIAAVLELVIVDVGSAVAQKYPGPEFSFLNGNSTAGAFFLVLVIAPFVEEALKASGVVQYRSSMRRLADGPVFGAAVGLGFGFFETLLYGLGAFLAGGLVAGLALILIRSISSVLLHGSSTAMFGRGYAADAFQGTKTSTGATTCSPSRCTRRSTRSPRSGRSSPPSASRTASRRTPMRSVFSPRSASPSRRSSTSAP